MKLEQYVLERERTENKNQTSTEKMLNYALGIGGETGECVDLVKKLVFHGHDYEEVREKLIKELGDDFWYRFGLMELFGIKFEDVLDVNVLKLGKRYKDGFSVEESINRVED